MLFSLPPCLPARYIICSNTLLDNAVTVGGLKCSHIAFSFSRSDNICWLAGWLAIAGANRRNNCYRLNDLLPCRLLQLHRVAPSPVVKTDSIKKLQNNELVNPSAFIIRNAGI